jgi:hypothetical protein
MGWAVSFTLRHLCLGERTSGGYWIGCWVDSRAGLDDVDKRKISYLCRESNLCRQARIPSPYQLNYPGYIHEPTNKLYLLEKLIVAELSKRFLRHLWKPKAHYRVHKSPPRAKWIQSTLFRHVSIKIIIPTSTRRCSKWSLPLRCSYQNFVMHFTHALRVAHVPPIFRGHSNNTWRKQIMELILM